MVNALSAGSYSYQADVWSFGMILYELMCLKKPFTEHDTALIPSLILNGQKPEMPTVRPSYSFLAFNYPIMVV